jgi:hypothetical protein
MTLSYSKRVFCISYIKILYLSFVVREWETIILLAIYRSLQLLPRRVKPDKNVALFYNLLWKQTSETFAWVNLEMLFAALDVSDTPSLTPSEEHR